MLSGAREGARAEPGKKHEAALRRGLADFGLGGPVIPGVPALAIWRPALLPWLAPLLLYCSYLAGVLSHNHNHCPVFVGRRSNLLYGAWLSFFYGFPGSPGSPRTTRIIIVTSTLLRTPATPRVAVALTHCSPS